MFGFLNKIRKHKLSFEQLKALQFVVQQVVVSIEGSMKLEGAEKKALALQVIGEILDEMNLVAPDSLVDALIESAVTVLKALDKTLEDAARPKFTMDISGRPQTGNGQ